MKKILVVDDSRIMRNIVKNTFLSLKVPCEFVEANDGAEALIFLKKYQFDLVFLDWNMSNLSGIDFLNHVRSIEKNKDLPIVMVTSEASRYNVIEALKKGATGYLVKPVSEEKFRITIKKLNLL